MPETISQAEYARRRGMTSAAVVEALDSGRLTGIPGANGVLKVDLDKADGEPEEPPKYWAVKTRKEQALAQLAELKLAELANHLVATDRVRKAAEAAGRLVRDAFLLLPMKVAPGLVGLTDAWEIEKRLEAAIRQVLDDAAQLTVSDLKRAIGDDR